MSYIATVQSIAQSAQSTLLILDKQARKDATTIAHASYQVYCFLTSPAAVKRYKIAYKVTKELVTIAAMVCIAIWTTIQEQSDRLVESCLDEPRPAIELESATEPESLTEAEAVAIAVECGLIPAAAPVVRKSRKVGRSAKGFAQRSVPKLA